MKCDNCNKEMGLYSCLTDDNKYLCNKCYYQLTMKNKLEVHEKSFSNFYSILNEIKAINVNTNAQPFIAKNLTKLRDYISEIYFKFEKDKQNEEIENILKIIKPLILKTSKLLPDIIFYIKFEIEKSGLSVCICYYNINGLYVDDNDNFNYIMGNLISECWNKNIFNIYTEHDYDKYNKLK